MRVKNKTTYSILDFLMHFIMKNSFLNVCLAMSVLEPHLHNVPDILNFSPFHETLLGRFNFTTIWRGLL